MVDFQSRDTSRGLSDDESDEETSDDTADDEPEGQAAPDDAGEADASTGDVDGREERASHDDQGHGADGHGDHARDDHESGGHDKGHAHDHDQGHAHDHGPDVGQLGVAIVTVSSSRTREDDPSGDAIEGYVESSDHEVVTREVVVDDLDGVQRAVLALTGRDDVDAVVTTGGTGVTPDDVTVEAIEPLFDKHLPGFGELFRILSFEEVGTRAMSSRTTAGISEGVPVFCLPGSENAVRLGMEELVLAELEHLVGLATRE